MKLSDLWAHSAKTALVASLSFFSVSSYANELEEVEVIGVTPTGGAGLDASKIPYNVQQASSQDLEDSNGQSISEFLNSNFASININDAQNNPLQRDIYYRGFSSSPLLGLPQGLSVFQNGVRVNEPLGDAVNYDLIPESAVHSITLIGGGNPVFGLNTLGGAIAYEMKNGFNFEGASIDVSGGSYGRRNIAIEGGWNNGTFGTYINVSNFNEDGWRDLSPSDATNLYAALSYRGDRSELDLAFQHGDTDLTGNGAIPIGLLDIQRDAIFTAPDTTDNKLNAFTLNGLLELTETLSLSGNAFHRSLKTNSFNGDGSEFEECELTVAVAGIGAAGDEVLVEEDDADDCNADSSTLDDDDVVLTETQLDALNLAFADDVDAVNGINNTSARDQESSGADFQFTLDSNLFGKENQLVWGAAYFKAESDFDAEVELASIDPVTRSTFGRGIGVEVEEEETQIRTKAETLSIYFTDTIQATDSLSLTFSGRYDWTDVTLRDKSGQRPELNGDHIFQRFNPAVGATYQVNDNINLYTGYSESSRIPTPIELSCNDTVADAFRARTGDDDFECRLPNAFLADPPLDQVVTRSIEVGARGDFNGIDYNAGFFISQNTDDIIFQSTGRATGLFANVDKTQRLGVELGLSGEWNNFDWRLGYSYVEATFETDFVALSGETGTQQVNSGDRIPGIPEHQLKTGFEYRFANGFYIGPELIYNSDQHMRGDEGNTRSTVDGYAIVNLRAGFQLNEHIKVYGRVNNLLDTDYETFGVVGEDPTEVISTLTNNSNFFLGPGAPISAFIGAKISF